jgi:hypothetical protein
MSFFNKLPGLITRRKAIAPAVNDTTNSQVFAVQDDNTNSFIAGHENYNDYVDLPNILGPMNTNVAFHDPTRVHAPFALEREVDRVYGNAGVTFFDGANPTIERIPRSDLQVQFDQKREIPIPPALVPATGVLVPKQNYNYGWRQLHPIQWDAMYQASALDAPSPQLNRSINVIQKTLPNDVHRQSLKTRAPKQKRSVQ